MDIERIIEFLQENKKELGDTNLGFYNYVIILEQEEYILHKDIGVFSETKILLPISKEKDWDIFLQKVKEEITPIHIDKKQIKIPDDKYLKKLLGMYKEQAAKKIKDDGFILRIVEEDGVGFIITDDLRQERINLRINNNKVIRASRG